MATCQKCGRTIDDGEKYCPSCKETRDQKKKGFFKNLVAKAQEKAGAKMVK